MGGFGLGLGRAWELFERSWGLSGPFGYFRVLLVAFCIFSVVFFAQFAIFAVLLFFFAVFCRALLGFAGLC